MRFLLYIRHTKALVMDSLASKLGAMVPQSTFGAHIIYQHQNEELLQKKGRVQYESVYSTEDLFRRFKNETLDLNYVHKLEEQLGKRHGWLHLLADRDLMPSTHYRKGYVEQSHDELLRWFQAFGKHTEEVLDDFRPDVYLDFAITSGLRSVTRALCRARGIHHLTASPARFEDFYFINTGGADEFPEAIQHYEEKHAEFGNEAEPGDGALKQMPDYHSKRLQEFEKRAQSWDSPRILRAPLTYLKTEYKRVTEFDKANYRANKKFANTLIDALARDFRKLALSVKPMFEAIAQKEDFAYFPLSVIPEASSSVLAPLFLDELTAIRMTAYSLPLHMKLYVREHTPMLYKRPLDFYRTLKTIPNIRLIDPKEDSLSLIRKAEAVVCLSGTSGLESLLLGTPCAVFGSPWYRHLPKCYYIEDVRKLNAFFKKLSNYQMNSHEQTLLAEAIRTSGFKFSQRIWWEKGMCDKDPTSYESNVRALAKAIILKLHKLCPAESIKLSSETL